MFRGWLCVGQRVDVGLPMPVDAAEVRPILKISKSRIPGRRIGFGRNPKFTDSLFAGWVRCLLSDVPHPNSSHLSLGLHRYFRIHLDLLCVSSSSLTATFTNLKLTRGPGWTREHGARDKTDVKPSWMHASFADPPKSLGLPSQTRVTISGQLFWMQNLDISIRSVWWVLTRTTPKTWR